MSVRELHGARRRGGAQADRPGSHSPRRAQGVAIALVLAASPSLALAGARAEEGSGSATERTVAGEILIAQLPDKPRPPEAPPDTPPSSSRTNRSPAAAPMASKQPPPNPLVNATRADFPEVPDVCYTYPAFRAIPVQRVRSYETQFISEDPVWAYYESQSKTRLLKTDGYCARTEQTTQIRSKYEDRPGETQSYRVERLNCGILTVSWRRDNEFGSDLIAVEEVRGSLFPLRVGNSLSFQRVDRDAKDGKVTRYENNYEVIDRKPASQVDGRIKGEIFRVRERTTRYASGPSVRELWLSPDLGIMFSASEPGKFTERLVSFER